MVPPRMLSYLPMGRAGSQCYTKSHPMTMSRMLSYLPMGRAGSQCYTKSHPMTEDASYGLIPWLTTAIETIPFRDQLGQPFTLCDYGTADGGMSAPLIQACADQIHRMHGASTEIRMIYEDLPTNDFQSVFALPQESNVYVSAVGKSFYEQCCPSETVHLGFACMATNWLSKSPCVIPDSQYASLTEDNTTKRMFAEQAALDWTTFLRQREKEMVPGCQIVLRNVLLEDNGRISIEKSMSIQDESWGNLFNDKIITEQEFIDATSPLYHRSHEEYLKPFTEEAASHPRQLRLLATDIERVPCFRKHWDSAISNGTDSKRRFAAGVANSIHQWSHYIYTGALSPSRSQENRQEILDRYTEGLKALIEEDPEAFINMDFRVLTMLIQKQ